RRMSNAPECSHQRGARHALVFTYYRRNGDEMIRIQSMMKSPDKSRCKNYAYARVHLIPVPIARKTRAERLDDSTSTTMSTKFEPILCELICGDGESHETQHKNQYGYYCDGNPCRAQRFFFNNGRMADLHQEQKHQGP